MSRSSELPPQTVWLWKRSRGASGLSALEDAAAPRPSCSAWTPGSWPPPTSTRPWSPTAPHPTRRVGFPAGLTGREVEILRLLVRGRSERQIAAELLIAASTVHTHITHLYDKAGVSTRAGAAVFAMEHGLIHPAPAT